MLHAIIQISHHGMDLEDSAISIEADEPIFHFLAGLCPSLMLHILSSAFHHCYVYHISV